MAEEILSCGESEVWTSKKSRVKPGYRRTQKKFRNIYWDATTYSRIRIIQLGIENFPVMH